MEFPAEFERAQKAHGLALARQGLLPDAIRQGLRAEAARCGYETVPVAIVESWMPFGGATSFDEMDQYVQARDQEEAVYALQSAFTGIVENIIAGEDPWSTKLAKIVAAANAMQDRLGESPRNVLEDSGWRDDQGPSLWQRLLGRKTAPAAPVTAAGPGTFQSFRDADGRLRFLTVYTNCFEDSYKTKFSYRAHEEFVEYCDGEQVYPELWLWHTPGTRLGVADYLALTSEGFMVASGVYDDGLEPVVERLEAMGPLDVSHGFDYKTLGGIRGGVVQPGYRSFEISILPLGKAANKVGTGFVPNVEETTMFTAEKREFLTKIVGDALAVEKLEKSLEEVASRAKAEGHEFTWRDLEGVSLAPTTPAPGTPAPASTSDHTEADDVVGAVRAMLEPIVKANADIIERLTALEKPAASSREEEEDPKVLRFSGPTVKPFVASEADSTVQSKREAGEMGDQGPGDMAHLKGPLGLMGVDLEKLLASSGGSA